MTASRRHLNKRATPDHPLTAKKLECLRWIAELGFLIPPQVADLTGMSLKAVRQHLMDLYHHSVADRILVAPDLYGRAPTIYKVTKEGVKQLELARMIEPDSVKLLPNYGPTNTAFLNHELEVRDVRAWLEVQARNNPGHGGIELWKTGGDAYVLPYRPDAVFAYRLKTKALVGFVEVDRGTERGERRWEEKITQYATVYHNNLVDQTFGYKLARVIIVVPNERRQQAIAAIISRLQAELELPAQRFWLVTKEQLPVVTVESPVWWVPDEPYLLPLVPHDQR